MSRRSSVSSRVTKRKRVHVYKRSYNATNANLDAMMNHIRELGKQLFGDDDEQDGNDEMVDFESSMKVIDNALDMLRELRNDILKRQMRRWMDYLIKWLEADVKNEQGPVAVYGHICRIETELKLNSSREEDAKKSEGGARYIAKCRCDSPWDLGKVVAAQLFDRFHLQIVRHIEYCIIPHIANNQQFFREQGAQQTAKKNEVVSTFRKKQKTAIKTGCE